MKIVISLHKNYTSGSVAAICMVLDTILPVIAQEHMGWLRWRIPFIAIGVVALVALLHQLVVLSRQEQEREAREIERDEREAERDSLLKKFAEHFKIDASRASLANVPALAVATSLQASDPRVYIDVERERGDFPSEPKSVFTIRNDGESEARRIAIEPLALLKGSAKFDTIESLAAHNHTTILPETTDRFERHDIGKIMLRTWDAVGELSEEFSAPMRVTYQDFSGRSFETKFDLVLFPIDEVLFNKRDNWHRVAKTLTVRNIEIRPQ